VDTWGILRKYLKDNGITYSEYLLTDHWKDIRERKLASKSSYICYACGERSGLELHHKTYKRIGKEWLNDLVWLCRDCHEKTHVFEREHHGKRNSLYKAARYVRKKNHKQSKIDRKRIAS
jgi:hypothetical protein